VLIGRANLRNPVTKVMANIWSDNAILAYVSRGARAFESLDDHRVLSVPGTLVDEADGYGCIHAIVARGDVEDLREVCVAP
jgi:hypothetical protein